MEVVKVLVTHGAKLDVFDRRGRTPLSIAEERGFDEIAAFLKGAMVEQQERSSDSKL